MKKRAVAVLGLGDTGSAWAKALHSAGWNVRVFDPSDMVDDAMPKGAGFRRCDTISGAVRDAAWIIVALPQRLELVTKVIQRAQAEAPAGAIVVSTAGRLDLDAMQMTSPRPERIVMLRPGEDGEIALKMTRRNTDGLRADVLALVSEIEADLDLPPFEALDAGDDAKLA